MELGVGKGTSKPEGQCGGFTFHSREEAEWQGEGSTVHRTQLFRQAHQRETGEGEGGSPVLEETCRPFPVAVLVTMETLLQARRRNKTRSEDRNTLALRNKIAAVRW